MTVRFFQNGNVKLIKNRKTSNYYPVFLVWRLIEDLWIYDGKVAAKDFDTAYRNYLIKG
jgi:hypothetical protein